MYITKINDSVLVQSNLWFMLMQYLTCPVYVMHEGLQKFSLYPAACVLLIALLQFATTISDINFPK